MSSLLFYIFFFVISAFCLNSLQRIYRRGFVIKLGEGLALKNDKRIYFTLMLICVMPIVLIYGFRYGIGTDYFSYYRIYSAIHNASLSKYFELHRRSRGAFYVEIGYYILNRVCNNFRLSLFMEGSLIYILLLVVVEDYSNKLNIGMAVYIYLCTQFTYSTNSIRFAIGLMFILCGWKYLADNEIPKFIIFVIIGAMFHKTLSICLLFFVFKEFKNSKMNRWRDLFFILSVFIFPFIIKYILQYIKSISMFRRYFTISTYETKEIMANNWFWTIHILPVIMPLIVFGHKVIKSDRKVRTLFRIYLSEIPLRMLGLYNIWYTRMARCGQIIVVLLVPYVLFQIEDRKKKRLLTIYYLLWYTFYFCYYAVVNDQGDTLPYVSIFTQNIR